MSEFFAVYTIADPVFLAETLSSGGRGMLIEGRPWKKVTNWLQHNAEKIPLLLGDASIVNGVEWVAYVDQVEITDGKTTCFFSNLHKLQRRIPLSHLRKASDNTPLSRTYTRPYVPCLITKKTSATILKSINLKPSTEFEVNKNYLKPPIKNIGFEKNYIQYHNTNKIGSRPEHAENKFSIYTSKPIQNLINQQMWLISGEGLKGKKFYLEYTFTIDEIELGTPNLAKGSSGFIFNPPILLNNLPWFEDFKNNQQNFSLGVREIDENTVKELKKLIKQDRSYKNHAEQLASKVTPAQFLKALQDSEAKLTDAQKEMLLAHANARDHAISMGFLASIAGYSSFEAANIQYGKVGALIADALGISGLDQKTQMLGVPSTEFDDKGHWRWVMRPALVEALRKLWPTNVLQKPDEFIAAAEIDLDPQCEGLKPTVRATLIQARIGQGIYRKALLEYWGGCCAVTGCDLDVVLIASHAKPWSQSTNKERLDPFNGILLAASVDKLFDKGLISFADDGEIMVSEELTDKQLGAIGLSRTSRLSRIEIRHTPYLRAHREHIFKFRGTY